MSEALIIDAVRTPIGRHGGALSGIRPDDLAALVVRASVERSGVPPEEVEDVYFGCANGAGEDNRDVARMAALLGGLPVGVPGVTVNRLCSSGLEAVNQAGRTIRLSEADILLAGGVESMSRAPFVTLKPERAFTRGDAKLADSTIGWRFVNPRMAERYSTEALGETAENVAEYYEISREDQDAFALSSHQRALAAAESGRFDSEVIPVSVPQRKGEPVLVTVDEGPRKDVSMERLSELPPIFREGGTVTAGTSSQISDGAACLVLASEQSAERLGSEPFARIVSSGVAGVDPAYMGVGPIPAVRQALRRANLTVEDLDLVELNEAFASQVLACARELEIPLEKLNVNGGAIALGHPLGCSGARLIGTLCRELRLRRGRYGIATLCVGVGQGLAVIVENLVA